MTIKEKLLQKFNVLASQKPCGIDLTELDAVKLFQEAQSEITLNQSFNRFGQIFRELEGLKQFVVPYYNQNANRLNSFKNAIFYNELVQIQVFYEFVKDLQVDTLNFPQLDKIIQVKNNERLNKIRNSIAHFNWTIEGDVIIFKDNNYERRENYYEISALCSLFSMIAIFMANNINDLNHS